MRRFLAAVAVVLLAGDTRAADVPYTPPPAASVPNYFATALPCKIEHMQEPGRLRVDCKDDLLGKKTLRELSIMRNTIYARYGWDGYRKPWLRAYFHAQPWFRPNPRFSYKLLSQLDRANAHVIGVEEQSYDDRTLARMRDDLYARYGRVWTEKPTWVVGDKEIVGCEEPKGAEDNEFVLEEWPACYYAKQPWYKPNPKFTLDQIGENDRIELGLISRALGRFALDERTRGKSEESLDGVLAPNELRQLSLRDLRLLRNTIYARRGRTFKSEALQKHFAGMKWYHRRDDYSDKLLTANDVRNVAMIRSVENEFGGPLNDEDWLIDPVTDGA